MSKNFRPIFAILTFLILILSIGTYTFFNFFKSNTKTDFQNSFSSQNSQNNSKEISTGQNSNNSFQTNSQISSNSGQNSQNLEIKNKKITLENLQAKENKFDNWNEIKFAGKINKISDIPANVMSQIMQKNKIPGSVPAYGFRFYNGVAFWASGGDGIYAFDGQKITNLNTYNFGGMDNYISRLIEGGKTFVYTNTGKNSISGGFFIDLQNGKWWTEKSTFTDGIRDIITEKSVMEKYKKFDFMVLTEPNSYNVEYFELYFDGKIYGKFTKSGEKHESRFKYYIFEDDGIKLKPLYESLGSGELVINSRGNLVSFGIQFLDENGGYLKTDNENVENVKVIITEQDFQTGKLLATQKTQLNDLEAYKKFGIGEFGQKYLNDTIAEWQINKNR